MTPVLAVINELSKHDPALSVTFVSDSKFVASAKALLEQAVIPVETKTIRSGKFRRYHGIAWYRQLLDMSTTAHNIGDIFLVIIGLFQSLILLRRERPDVVFTKGGFVCLPLGWAAGLLHIPLVIHDSDSHPGLTNRLLARFATTIATGASLENYTYDKTKAHYVGIPVAASFHPIDKTEQLKAKTELGLPDISWPLIVVTGGGLGAVRINEAMLLIGEQLLDEHIAVIHITGNSQYKSIAARAPKHPCYIVKPFVDNGMAGVLAAADIVISRAGATALAEIAAMAKPLVVIPNRILTGGHQVKNASVYSDVRAAVVINEQQLVAQPHILLDNLLLLLKHPQKAAEMAKRLHEFAKPQAAAATAALIVGAFISSNREEQGRRADS